MGWLRHAFAVEAPGSSQPDAAQREIIDRLCITIVRRGLTTPALLYLEVCRPLNFIGSQAMHFFQPLVAAIADTRGYERFARFLERRGSVDYLIERLEHFEARRPTRQRGPQHERHQRAGEPQQDEKHPA